MDLLKKIIILIFFTISVVLLSKVFLVTSYLDFNAFYAATHAFYMGNNPYGQLPGALVSFLYAPTSFIFFSPFLLFPLPIASLLWTLLSIIMLLFCIGFLFRISNKNVYSYEFLGILSLVFLMFPIRFNLGMGQVGILNLFLVTLFMYYLSNKKDKLSALFLSQALLLKFSPLFFPVYLIFLRRWKAVFSLVVISTLLVVAVTLFRPEQMIYFVTVSLPGTFSSWPLSYYNQAVSGFVGRSLGTGLEALFIRYMLSVLIVGLSFYSLWKKRNQKQIEQIGFALLLPLSILVAPLAWQHYFVLAIPSFMILYFHYRKTNTRLMYYLLLAISYFLVSFNIKNPENVPLLLQSHVFIGAMVLWGLCLKRVWEYE